MTKTMAALTFVRKGRLEWRDAPAPRLHGPHEALVRPIVASRCDGDCLFLFHDYSRALQLGAHRYLIKYPCVQTINTIVRSVYPQTVF